MGVGFDKMGNYLTNIVYYTLKVKANKGKPKRKIQYLIKKIVDKFGYSEREIVTIVFISALSHIKKLFNNFQ